MNSYHAHETSIVSDPDVPLVRITREFDAPAASVFLAHVDPGLIVQWLGPRDLVMTVDHWDPRTGGSYRYVMTRPGEEHAFHGSFHDVRPSGLIVQTFAYEGVPDAVALERLVLTDLPGGRCRLNATSLTDSFEARDAHIASGMAKGVIEGYERLDAVFDSM